MNLQPSPIDGPNCHPCESAFQLTVDGQVVPSWKWLEQEINCGYYLLIKLSEVDNYIPKPSKYSISSFDDNC